MKTYVPEKHKRFWKRHLFAMAYGNKQSIYLFKGLAPLTPVDLFQLKITRPNNKEFVVNSNYPVQAFNIPFHE